MWPELTERLLSATNHPEAEETLPVVTRFEAVRKNGEEFWAELRISPLLDDDGKPFGSIGALFDVTNSVLAQSRFEAANERFTLVVESMASAIAVLAEPNRDVLFFANRSYRTLFNDRHVRQNSLPAWKGASHGTKRRHFRRRNIKMV